MVGKSLEMFHLGLVTPTLRKNDGQGRVNFEIVKRVLELGGRVTALTRQAPSSLLESERFRLVPISDGSLPTSFLRSQLFALNSERYLAKHAHKMDLIHANGSVTLYPSDVNAAHFVHSAWLNSGAHTSHFNRNAYGLYHRFLSSFHSVQERKAYFRAKHVVAISEQVRDQLERVGVRREKISVIWNGIDVDEFSPGEMNREKWRLPGGLLALFAGDMTTPRKNLDTVLAALPHVPNLKLAIAGETRNNPYPRIVAQKGLGDRVTFLGFRRDLPDLMKAVDLFVYPARYEPLGLVVLEALASGVPVVTAKTVGASALVDRSCGIVVDEANDPLELAAALRSLAEDKSLRRAMGVAARSRSLEHTWGRMADEYVRLYEIALAERRAPRRSA